MRVVDFLKKDLKTKSDIQKKLALLRQMGQELEEKMSPEELENLSYDERIELVYGDKNLDDIDLDIS